MRLFFVVFGLVLGFGAMVSGDTYGGYPSPGSQIGEPVQNPGFFGTVLSFPKRIVLAIFRAVVAVLRLIFVRTPEGIADVIKRVFYRVAHLFGKKDPYDQLNPLITAPGLNPSGYNQQTAYTKSYNYNPSGYNYGNGVYRNPYGRKK